MSEEKNVKLVALDQLHISSVQANTIARNAEFEVDAAAAADLVARGLARKVAAPRKAAAAPQNKAAPAPSNKSSGRRTAKR